MGITDRSDVLAAPVIGMLANSPHRFCMRPAIRRRAVQGRPKD